MGAFPALSVTGLEVTFDVDGGPLRAVAGLTAECSPRTTSVALARSSRYIASIRSANAASSATMSSSQFPSQLAMLRLVEPTRAQRPSATAVLACSIVPFHSKTRTPASSSGR